jgi:hypothetical protein
VYTRACRARAALIQQTQEETARKERLHQQALEQLRAGSPTEASNRQDELETTLPPAPPGSSFVEEWELFRRELGRLLAEGCKGRFALIRTGEEITVWDSLRDAEQAGRLLHGPALCLIQQILPRLRSLRAG